MSPTCSSIVKLSSADENEGGRSSSFVSFPPF